MGAHVRELFDLSGRTALITGGSRGLGLQLAEALGEAGASVLLTSRKETDLQRAAEHLRRRGINADFIAGDASKPEIVERVCVFALERLGGIDVLVNNAGATWGAPAEDYPLDAWSKVMNLNVQAVFLFSQRIAKQCMIPRRNGRIINLASIAAFSASVALQRTVAYHASKSAVVGMTRELAAEWGTYNITVNAIAPGLFPSKMTEKVIETASEETIAGKVPLGRLGDDEDLKGAVTLLASRAGKYITGQTLVVDGGYTIDR